MTNHARETDVQKRWVEEAKQADLGLWWLADDVREILGPEACETEVCNRTIDLLEPLLRSGDLRAVDLLPEGRFREWPGEIVVQLEKIERLWAQLDRKPRIGDIVTFLGPR